MSPIWRAERGWKRSIQYAVELTYSLPCWDERQAPLKTPAWETKWHTDHFIFDEKIKYIFGKKRHPKVDINLDG